MLFLYCDTMMLVSPGQLFCKALQRRMEAHVLTEALKKAARVEYLQIDVFQAKGHVKSYVQSKGIVCCCKRGLF